MPVKTEDRYPLTSFGIGSPFSYGICGEHVVGRLFGILPVIRIHLGAVYYLRLASPSDTTPIFLFFNWMHFMPHKRSVRPVYILQTRARHRIFLKLDSASHFKLRQAIGKHTLRNNARVAA